jgi:UV DNA damage endonuclease
MHYSQQDPAKRPGSHSGTIAVSSFMEFCSRLEEQDVDLMLEVKDKNISAIKCINAVSRDKNIKYLELEWSRYKYSVLENSPAIYLEIRKLLNNKQDYPVIPFYNLIEEAMKTEKTKGNAVNAMQHVWGYFKNTASDIEKKRFLKMLQEFEKGQIASVPVKSFLWRMAAKYDEKYLLDSYYFIL